MRVLIFGMSRKKVEKIPEKIVEVLKNNRVDWIEFKGEKDSNVILADWHIFIEIFLLLEDQECIPKKLPDLPSLIDKIADKLGVPKVQIHIAEPYPKK